jgi:hypothetical protein
VGIAAGRHILRPSVRLKLLRLWSLPGAGEVEDSPSCSDLEVGKYDWALRSPALGAAQLEDSAQQGLWQGGRRGDEAASVAPSCGDEAASWLARPQQDPGAGLSGGGRHAASCRCSPTNSAARQRAVRAAGGRLPGFRLVEGSAEGAACCSPMALEGNPVRPSRLPRNTPLGCGRRCPTKVKRIGYTWSLFGVQNRTTGPYLAAINRTLISVTLGRGSQARGASPP